MAERAFNVVQLGVQAVHGTSVAATSILPVDPGVIQSEDRGYASPDEDYGRVGRHNPGRAYYGVRGATFPLNGEVTFEDIIRVLSAHGGTGVITIVNLEENWAFTWDETSDTKKRLTAEVGTKDTTQDQWRVGDVLVDELELSYEDLTVPGASPWRYSATCIGKAREVFTLTGALAAPPILETAQGHLTTLLEGSTATAFASLTELTNSLVGYRLRSSLGLARRIYGGTADTFSAYGFGRAEVDVTARVKISATSKANIYDIWNVAQSPVTERRWRVKVLGTTAPGSSPATPKSITIDHRLIFEEVVPADRDGEDVYEVAAHAAYDTALASRLQVNVYNAVAALP